MKIKKKRRKKHSFFGTVWKIPTGEACAFSHAPENELLKKMLGSCGEDVTVQTPFKVVYGKNLYIGDHVFINYNSSILDGGEIRIGSRVLIGPDTKIYAGNHSLNPDERIVVENGKMRLISIPQPVTIGDDVWIGGNVTILPGVTIGDNVTIGAYKKYSCKFNSCRKSRKSYKENKTRIICFI